MKGKVRKYLFVIISVVAFSLLAVGSALAIGFGISPSKAELDIPAGGYDEAQFTISNFEGSLSINLEDIPLVVSPTVADVDATNNKVTVRIYSSNSVASQTFNGKICFLAVAGHNVATGIKVKAIVHHNKAQTGDGIDSSGGTSSTTSQSTTPSVSLPATTPPEGTPPAYTPPPSDVPAEFVPVEGIPMPTPRSTVNWGIVFLVGCAVLLAGFTGWSIWKNQRLKKKKIDTPQF